jgi:hypothetical protein
MRTGTSRGTCTYRGNRSGLGLVICQGLRYVITVDIIEGNAATKFVLYNAPRPFLAGHFFTSLYWLKAEYNGRSSASG